jgi:ATP-dependent Lhr-like helicase
VRSEPELHPLIQHHIVNSLGWPRLRPFQEEAVGPLTAGNHALLVAPTAGGKTEAATFPVLSRMLEEDWRGLSVLYLCPLRALLNNLHPRLAGYSDLVGRRAGLWHGDVTESARERIRHDPPDILLTTPESVEAMLISSKTDHSWIFRNLHAVVVDEIHAFAGDDRGWHLLSVVQRLQRLAGRRLQRIGLSATVGDPEALLAWLMSGTDGSSTLITPEPGQSRTPDLTVDHVGSLANAAIVLSRLHRGEKRLVFVDSRRRAEELTREIRLQGEQVWLSHGSLGRDERAATEEAFATSPAGIIVATSTLELGIDIGDLDRVAQIDAPWTVAGFLQRLGRTGRRAGVQSNCLFLTTSERALRDALGLLQAWATGFVEPVAPPSFPVNVLVQQLLALLRQEGFLGRHTWSEWLGSPVVLGDDVEAVLSGIVDHMLATGALIEDGGMLGIGPVTERRYGKMNYLNLTAVFSDPPTLSVAHGGNVIGTVHLKGLQRSGEDPGLVLLAGRDWKIVDIDWRRRMINVVPATGQTAKASWVGEGMGQSAAIARATREVLAGVDPDGVRYSKRVGPSLGELRSRFGWLDQDKERTYAVTGSDGQSWWWTFGGTDANRQLASALGNLAPVTPDSGLAVRLTDGTDARHITEAVDAGLHVDGDLPDDLADVWKFAELLPAGAAARLLAERGTDPESFERVTGTPVKGVSVQGPAPRP